MQLADRLTVTDASRSTDGYVKVRARAARSGVYDYLGAEVDPEGKRFKAGDTVKVYRPADEVFDKASLASFALKPITDDHPRAAVNSANWRDHARGTIIGAVKDGDYVGFDLAFMDSDTVAKLDSGKRELSNGYSCDLAFEDGTAPDGTAYQAVQRNIRGNHVALVDRGRAGPDCRVADQFAVCDALPTNIFDSLTKEKPVSKTMLIDGLTVDIANADTAMATIQTLVSARDAANAKVAGLETQVSTLTAEKTTQDAKITTLEQQVKDAKPTAAQLLDAGKAYAAICDKAKALGVTFAADAEPEAIMAATVSAKMGDAAKDWTADQIAASFAVLTKDAKPAAPANLQDFRGGIVSVGDAAQAEQQAWMKASDHNAWRTAGAAN